MEYISRLIKTWLFLLRCDDPQLSESRYNAQIERIKLFGSVALAELYLEQKQDQYVEVVLL